MADTDMADSDGEETYTHSHHKGGFPGSTPTASPSPPTSSTGRDTQITSK
ncbi:Uu.00g047520.m01.CDS01 [Anthostomella pinea]|uniref:Uu.00g047520.m01.CDS01 n=1 Tax=Anthostomella pinea TaxID=933095 RepID=A0AAI8YC73_9PEZI|nr:Uu.00g047520.m01.CDS01 [Anthostomella pinea]